MEPVTVTCQMVMQKPVATVFQAFANPDQTKNFWFTHATGKVEQGASLVWAWEIYNHSTPVKVLAVQEHELIKIEWGTTGETVVFNFIKINENATRVIIENSGFKETGQDLIKKIIDTTGGFTTVLDGAKCWLEHGINLRLINDKFI